MKFNYKFYITRNGVPIGEAKSTSCLVKFDSEADVTRGLQMTINSEIFENGRFNMFRDCIRPIIIINETEYSLGDFMIISAPKQMTGKSSMYRIQGYDKTMILKQTAFEDRVFYSAGTSYLNIIQQLLTSCGFTRVISDSSSAVLLTDREYQQGTTYLEVINELLEEINFERVHMEADNCVYLNKAIQKTSPDFIYSDKRDFRIIEPLTLTTDIYNLPNVLIGIMSNPDNKEPISYRRENNSVTSKISTINRGYKVVKVYRLNNIPSEQEMKDYIDRKYLESTQATETLELDTTIEPLHTYGTMIQIESELLNGLFVEKEWTIKFGVNGRMSHKLERKVLT